MIRSALGYTPRVLHELDRIQDQQIPASYVCGYARGKLANVERIRRDRVALYTLPARERELVGGECILVGFFLVAEDYVESCEQSATLLIGIDTARVLAVLRPVGLQATMRVLCNGLLLREEIRGRDVAADSTVSVAGALRQYELLVSDRSREGVVCMQVIAGSIRVYRFTLA